VLQSACPDPVRALFVFLYLLKSNPEGVPKLLLAHLEHQAAHTNPAADVVVDGVLGIWVRASGLQAALALSTILPQAREALPETREPVARDIRGGMIPNHAT